MREALRTQASSGTQGRKWLKPIPRRLTTTCDRFELMLAVDQGPGSVQRRL
jgi:hypothetical protein